MKKILLLLSILVVVIVSGCGSDNVLDKYSFGNQVIKVSNSEVTIPSPFELGYNSTITATKKGDPIKSYAGTNNKVLVNVEAYLPNGKPQQTPQSLVDDEINAMKNVQNFKVVKSESTTIMLSGTPALKQTITFIGQNDMKFSLLQYIFTDNDVLWNIVYQYRTDDAEGQAIVDYVTDKIQVTHKKEGSSK